MESDTIAWYSGDNGALKGIKRDKMGSEQERWKDGEMERWLGGDGGEGDG